MTESATMTTAPARTCRLVYYGPPGSGKSANLARMADSVPLAFRLPAQETEAREQFAFRVDAGDLGEWVVTVETADAVTVSAPADAGARFPFDGIVFVADSSADRLDLNLSALETLKTELEVVGLDLTSLPMVIQYNKQDAPGRLPLDRLESLLNPWGLPSFPAVTARGEGVRETLRAALGLALRHLDRAACAPASAADAAPTAAPPPGIEPEERSEALFLARRPPVVVPVRVPRSVLERYGTVRIVLELEVDGRGPGVD
jgi:hypothetical protein